MIYFGTLVQAWSLVLFFFKDKTPPHGIITWLSVGAWRGILSTLEMDNFHFQSSVVLSMVLGLFLIELLLGRLEIVEILRNQLNAFSRCSNLLLHCSCILEISVLSFVSSTFSVALMRSRCMWYVSFLLLKQPNLRETKEKKNH